MGKRGHLRGVLHKLKRKGLTPTVNLVARQKKKKGSPRWDSFDTLGPK